MRPGYQTVGPSPQTRRLTVAPRVTDPKFVDFAKGANVLIMHLALPAGIKNHPLHAAPDVVGRIAQEAGVGRMIISHIGIFDLDAALAEVKKAYTGPLTVGADLHCTPVK
jgi:ribonuclease BN (tRNA processing enzyme)